MDLLQFDQAKLDRFTLGNAEAADFLANHWSPYVHEIDDIVDGARTAPEDILSTFARAPLLFSHPFYLKHLPELRRLVLIINNAYADSVAFEKSTLEWQRQWADHNRHVAMELAIAVAQICGGYNYARTLSQEQRALCWLDHHDRDGKPI